MFRASENPSCGEMNGLGEATFGLMCRFFAAATGGTYVFLTNHSGIGGDHIAPTVGQYEVEYLNDLICRLIEAYIRAEN